MSQLATAPMPLTFWGLLQARLQGELRSQQARVQTIAAPIVVMVDTRDDVARLERAQEQFRAALQRLDQLSLLTLTLRTQLEACRFQIGVDSLQARIEFLGDLYNFYVALVKDRPSRMNSNQAVAQLRASYASASKPGGGEWAATERGRLLAQSVHVPVFSEEEAVPYEQSAQQLRNDLDTLKSRLESLQATTTLTLVVPPDLEKVLLELGIAFTLDGPEAAAPAPAAGAGTQDEARGEALSA